jgi:putative autotransporter adhesin-like protein
MSPVRAWLLMACSVLVSSCGVINAVDGSGKVITEPRTVANFSSITLSGEGELALEQTGSESLTVTTDDNLLPYIEASVDGSTLRLGLKDNAMTRVRPTRGIVFKVTVKQLENLEVSGSGKADLRNLAGDQVRIRISGYHGQDLKSKRAQATISGSGTAIVNASEALDADVSGSGSIEYLGEPRLSSHVSGSGSVQRR